MRSFGARGALRVAASRAGESVASAVARLEQRPAGSVGFRWQAKGRPACHLATGIMLRLISELGGWPNSTSQLAAVPATIIGGSLLIVLPDILSRRRRQ